MNGLALVILGVSWCVTVIALVHWLLEFEAQSMTNSCTDLLAFVCACMCVVCDCVSTDFMYGLCQKSRKYLASEVSIRQDLRTV